MAVSPEFQGKEIGGKLLSYAIEEARNRNLKYLYLLSNKKLKPPIHLYEKLGFKEVSVDCALYSRVDYKAELYL